MNDNDGRKDIREEALDAVRTLCDQQARLQESLVEADRDRATLLKSNRNCVRELAQIADALGVASEYEKVIAAIDALTIVWHNHGRLQKFLTTQSDECHRLQVQLRQIGDSLKEQYRAAIFQSHDNDFVDEVPESLTVEDILFTLKCLTQEATYPTALAQERNKLKDETLELQQHLSNWMRENSVLKQQVEELLPQATLGAAQEGLGSMISMLARDVRDPGAAKNCVEMRFAWDEGALPQMPFRKAALLFYRDGGKSPLELVTEAQNQLSDEKWRLSTALSERDEARSEIERLQVEVGILRSETKPNR